MLSFASAFLVCLSSPAFAADKEPFHQGWLDRDLQLIRKTKLALGPSFAQGADIEKFLKDLKPSDVRDDRDLGCGIRQVHMALYGGYTTIWMSVAVVEKKVVAMNCVESTSGSPWSRIAPALLKAWGDPQPVQDADSLKIAAYIDLKVIDDAAAREFGSVKIESPPGALQQPFALLTSPLEQTDVGEACYIGGEKPSGREAIEKLISADRYDLVRAVLRGPSPEGRAYAALALNTAKKALPDDVAVEDKLKKLNLKIHVCHGCLVSTETFSEVLLEKRYSPLSPGSSKFRRF